MIDDDEETRRRHERLDRRRRWQVAIMFAFIMWLYVCGKDIGGWIRGEDGSKIGILIGSVVVFGVVGVVCTLVELTREPSDPAKRYSRRR